ncbi:MULTISPECIES: ImmA/IrrE family metallo-endopeptidase [Aeromonas]|uniref:ImmA/IrrE family metallo-endopeptidase n=1 Tax=Aeromonas TaxID=642 RepID=UPI00037A2951|nr:MULTISPECIES: ImmA/IrrE family metallo-endopeptidase [Aeromonas]KLV40575.1 hypothetical protein SH16_02722 [Aeromonas caviae]MCF5851169.1 ImmA/IrrE family metallo-endopeptidase [Aeromonas veronii]TNI10876.1 hypothetical protein CF106_17565 [Aeromonas veronii]
MKQRYLANKVKPLSSGFIQKEVEKIREFIKLYSPESVDNGRIDIVRFLEVLHNHGQITIEYCENEELVAEYAKATPSMQSIKVRSSVYLDALDGNPRARFTLAHELGHLVLHHNIVPEFAHSQAMSFFDYTEDVEWQANEFASWLLVDPNNAEYLKNPRAIANHFGVSLEVAMYQTDKLRKYEYI